MTFYKLYLMQGKQCEEFEAASEEYEELKKLLDIDDSQVLCVCQIKQDLDSSLNSIKTLFHY